MSKALPEGPLAFVHGDDDFAVAQRARQIYHGWCEAEGGEDNEIIEAHSANAGEAVRRSGRSTTSQSSRAEVSFSASDSPSRSGASSNIRTGEGETKG